MYSNLCRKHYLQMKRHGKTYERTIYDKNPIEIDEENGVAYMTCFDRYGNKTCTTRFDAEFVDKVSKYKWYVRLNHISGLLYVMGSISANKKIFLHRFLIDAPRNMIVDHINHDTLDNLKENLRLCTNRQNSCNRKYNTSRKYPGVFQQYKTSTRWSATITVNYKNIWLGVFNTYEEALAARLAAEQKYFGEFRYTGHGK